MRPFTSSLLVASALLACGSPSTGGGGTPTPDKNPPVTVERCRERIAALTDELRAANVDVANWSFRDAPEMKEPTFTGAQTPKTYKQYDGRYRQPEPALHPGCSTANLYYDKKNVANDTAGQTPYKDGNNDGKWTGQEAFGGPNAATGFIDGDVADIPGFPCAAKQYTQGNPDRALPIVILVHGNSTRPHSWEKFLLTPGTAINSAFENVQFNPDTQARTQLAEALIAARYEVVAVDFRTDLVASVDPTANNTTENVAGNIDHGWSTPILESLVKAVIQNNPGRKVALVGHSLGVTVVRDALRRLYVESVDGVAGAVNPFAHVSHVILGSGANHGVSTYDPPSALCGPNLTMRGTIVCEMGSRGNYQQTYFHKPLNGPRDLFATPCADGDYAFGRTGQCEGNAVKYLTLTMTDINSGSNYQDLYVSESASRIEMPGCVNNTLTTLGDYDTSGYFNKGFIANHFGSVRSPAGLNQVLAFLAAK
ncbi:esterase/lipase family protein [Archangium primigenium]|uniref:esterase/lipase family protein n=1 Tax=[Archangium] primigenium TaxID=2792470 RepID=UPI00195A97DE|nr:alpha/beta fold hydrolase [Archangium primigenium]MBM7113602.1 alpha/beta hydrolase [Archangium primigenium]